MIRTNILLLKNIIPNHGLQSSEFKLRSNNVPLKIQKCSRNLLLELVFIAFLFVLGFDEDSNLKEYSCEKCNRSYKHKKTLKRHQYVECGQTPNFHCQYCPYVCHRKESFKRHVFRKHLEIMNKVNSN